MREGASLGAKSPLHERRSLDPVPPTVERGVQPREKIVEVSGDDAHSFLEGGGPAGHDEGDGQHGPGEIFDGDLDDDECYAFAAVVGGVGVG